MDRRADILAILEILEEVWLEHPDWRLGQVLCNVSGTTSPQIFYRQDESWLALLHNWGEMGSVG